MAVSAGTAMLGSAALGAVSGGKNKTSTATNKPWMPKEYEEGYNALLEDANKIKDRPFVPVMKTRYAEENPLFHSPEMAAIQGRHDQNYYKDMIAPKEEAPQEAPAVDPNLVSRGMQIVGGDPRFYTDNPGATPTGINGQMLQRFKAMERQLKPSDYAAIAQLGDWNQFQQTREDAFGGIKGDGLNPYVRQLLGV